MRHETMVVSRSEELLENGGRRQFLKLLGLGGTIVLLPSVLASCSSNNNNDSGTITGPASGKSVVIDFSKGDIAVLQFAYALEQLEADFYTRVVASFGSSNIPAAEQTLLADVKNHEVIHREAFKVLLGTSNDFTLSTTYGSLDFKNRDQVLAAARDFEDLGVSAYNGAAQYLTDVNYLGLAGKIVSVEARHASAIRDLINPKTRGVAGFSPTPFDDAFRPSKVGAAAQNYVVEKIQLSNAPTTFVQGPNGNG